MVIRFLITYFLWTSIFHTQSTLFGYTREQMITYVVLVYVVSNIVFASRVSEVGTEIYDGKLMNNLLKPMGYFSYLFARDLADKILNTICVIFELGIIFYFLKPEITFNVNPLVLSLFLVSLLFSNFIYGFISLLLGLLGFWSTEIWSSRFVFLILVDFLAGSFFPIDILPSGVIKILSLTPFPYLYYFPAKLYVGTMTRSEIVLGVIVLITWTILLWYIVTVVWRKGLRLYSAEGK